MHKFEVYHFNCNLTVKTFLVLFYKSEHNQIHISFQLHIELFECEILLLLLLWKTIK